MKDIDLNEDELKLLVTLADPSTHKKFIEYLGNLGLLASFLEAMNVAKQ